MIPRGITSEEDIEDFKSNYCEGEPENSYDTTSLVLEFKQRVDGDLVAREAMDLFVDCKYWHLVDHCEDNLPNMAENNSQLFKEVLILLGPELDIGDYTKRVIDIIGDPLSVTPDYFKNKKLLYDMFFYGAVECGRRGLC
jgi:hypothetical protein